MKSRRLWQSGTVWAILCVFFLLLALKNSEIAANGIKKGLFMLENILFPSLLPFLILSELFVTLGAGRVLGRVIARPARALFGLTENGAAVLALGWLCGVPVGTVSAMTMLKNGDISREEFLRLLLFANTPSTGFLVGTVGGALFGNRTAGMVLFLCVLLAAALTGVALKLQGGNLPPCGTMQHTPQRVSFFRALTSAIQKSVFTMMGVAGFVLFFSALSECVTVIATVRQLPPLLASLLCGALELTAGVSAVVSKHPPAVAFLLTAGFAGFAGLSICLQIFAVSADAQPRLCPYLTAKILQGAITLLLAALYLALAHPQLTVAQNGFAETVSTAGELHTYTRHTMLALLALLALIPLCRRRAVTFYRIEK